MQKVNRIVILASGSGTNAENIVKYFRGKDYAQVVLIATENPNAYVIERAKQLGIEHCVFTMSEMRDGSLMEKFKSLNADFVVLAGFLKLIPCSMVDAFRNRIVNIHPALLPKYGGKGMYGNRVHEAVVANSELESGITIHYVNGAYDSGDIIFQAKCDVLPSDTADSLAQKVHRLEYQYYPSVIDSLIKP